MPKSTNKATASTEDKLNQKGLNESTTVSDRQKTLDNTNKALKKYSDAYINDGEIKCEMKNGEATLRCESRNSPDDLEKLLDSLCLRDNNVSEDDVEIISSDVTTVAIGPDVLPQIISFVEKQDQAKLVRPTFSLFDSRENSNNSGNDNGDNDNESDQGFNLSAHSFS